MRSPAIPGSTDARIRNPIDSFVAARLLKEGLAFSPDADSTTLLRRISLDLTGLPPALDALDAFVSDNSSDAYDRAVERLLRSPHYGEKWARHWLDTARYADSNGFEKDRTRSVWPYRDYVIRSFNADLPFDQFTIEQLAGDLLDEPTRDQRIATGFLRNSMVNMEGGIEPEKFRVETIIDRVDAVGRTWLGLTIACAQCHDHKYDPIRMTDYYGFYGLLNQDDEPKLEVPNAAQQRRREEIVASANNFETDWARSTPDWSALEAQWEARVAEPVGHWEALDAKEWHSQPLKFEKQEDLSLLGGGDIYNNSVLRIWVETPLTHITGFRLEALNNANLPFNGPGVDADGGFQLCEFTVEATPLATSKSTTLTATNTASSTNLVHFHKAIADVEAPGWPAMATIDGNTTQGGWASAFTFGRRNEERRIVFEAEKPFGFEGGTRMLISLHCKPKESPLPNFMLGCVRVSMTTDPAPLAVDPLSSKQRRILQIPQAQRTADQRRELLHVFRTHEQAFATTWQAWDDLWKDWPKAEATTLALRARPRPRVTRLFKRGDWQRPLEAVSPDVPAILPRLPAHAPLNRLGLARWLVDLRNPLTARVLVNRVWQQYFGQGLVPTVEDLGTRSETPSHPELLDWLATEFMRRGWSFKELHRLIVGSTTYRQSSRARAELLGRDPYNRLLARGARTRVDAESVQDIALSASGLLNPKVGGPSVFPPLPDGVMQLSYGPIPWNTSEGEDRYRRAMYTFWKRSVPYPALTTFDAPSAEQSCVRRVRSNTPLQALVTLNEPTFQQAARWLGWRALRDGGSTDEARLDHAFRLCVSRQPDELERAALLRLLASSRAEFEQAGRDAATVAFSDPKNPPPMPPSATVRDLAAWTTVSRALLNLDETITKE
ncbi:MAG: DUF1553 domain-containing protein [Verrucomicrobia bacterium]|nr:DUF1553 domain-containing protein [Verrucomicrobiota bacterium]MBI3871277.1 DUF1553 domain-containing protein [Verrucomicrobiota bacterium]